MQTLKKRDPATGDLLAEVPVSSEEDLARTVALARAAQPRWSALGFEGRADLLQEGAARLEGRVDEVASLVTREMGKPLADARREARAWVTHTGDLLEEIGRAVAPETLRGPRGETLLVREPHGIVAAITPWNFPVAMPLQILVPALATGNTVVFKPSEHVPLTGAALAEVFGALLPDGVLQVVQGAGDVGAALVASDIDMVAFVGSRDTGVRIMRSAADGLKRLVLELGGKDPLVVFEDADLEAAAECAVRHSLRNSGQVCCAVERVYVAAPVAKEFEALVVAKAREWKSGSGFDETSRMGPMVSDEQRRKVHVQVEDALRGGARLLLGGSLPEGPGWFYPATVLADVTQELSISREETFGPVVSLAVFDGSEAEAVRLANDTPYGLGANVFTKDRDRALRVAGAIRSGQVGINQYLGGAPGLPWVGARQSGFGYLGGIEGHRQFTVPKSISWSQ